MNTVVALSSNNPADSAGCTLAIDGMTCASCVRRVEKTLLKQAGVVSAEVNLATETARIEWAAEGQVPDPEAVAAAIRKAGFESHRLAEPDEDLAETTAPRAQPFWSEGRRVALAALLSAPLLLPMMIEPLLATLTGRHTHLMLPGWLQLLLATPVQLWLGARFYRAGWAALRMGSGNMDLLVALGTSAAFGLSLFELLSSTGDGMPSLYFESAAVVITLVMLGKWLESRAKHRTLAALDALRALTPEVARVIGPDGQECEVPIRRLRLGNRVVVRPGERIPVDGEIVEGRSQIDESLLTGESLPVAREPGEPVTGGAVNGEGRLVVRATALGAESTLARIVRLVENAQARKAPIQRRVDQISAVFVPVVVVIALITGTAWLMSGAGWNAAVIHAVAVLVIACPCALGLATPAALMVGTGVAARHGILIKDAEVLELARRLDEVVFDKTGTLTEGHPEVEAVIGFGLDRERVLDHAAALQAGSEHPLARAVQRLRPQTSAARELEAVPGRGVRGITDDEAGATEWQLGSRRWMIELGLDLSDAALPAEALALQQRGLTLSWLARREGAAGAVRLVGLIAFGDRVKAEAAEAIRRLQRLGVPSRLLSGDQPVAVAAVATQLGLTHWHAEVLPQDKAAVVTSLREGGRRIAMVGDGLNDAPALAAADVGIAMASGTDVARHAAAITLVRSSPLGVADAIDISRRTTAKIHQNLFWAFIYNVIGIPLAAFGLLSPVIAGAAMAASSVSVISNALLLARWKPRKPS
jgi:P-type Cu+ transporter